jgi:hypothetical protein
MYRSIALLNIIEKILKFIMNKKISSITKTYRLLFDTFMKCRKNRSIKTIFKFFIEQIHIVWKQKTNRMIILLSLNVASVFDTMSHVKLIHDMKKRKISRWIIDWNNNFLFDRFTIFAMNREMIESFSMLRRTITRLSSFQLFEKKKKLKNWKIKIASSHSYLSTFNHATSIISYFSYEYWREIFASSNLSKEYTVLE